MIIEKQRHIPCIVHVTCMPCRCHLKIAARKQRQDKRCFKTKALLALFSYLGGQKQRKAENKGYSQLHDLKTEAKETKAQAS